jgi:hypothetical protein
VATAQAEREKQRQAAEEKKRADDELRAQPLKVGDRVRHKSTYHLGPGTIAEACGADVCEGGFYICYDSMGTCLSSGQDLQRLIPGDPGFEIVEGKRAAIEKRLAEYRVLLQRQRRPVVGDRVTDDINHYWAEPEAQGAGTVVWAGEFDDDYDDGFIVDFNNGKLGVNMMASQLRRLLPGDAGFIFAIGDRVAHGKFGLGTVESVDGNKIAVMFDAVGRKEVVPRFLERVE